MIRNDIEYEETHRRLAAAKKSLAKQEAAMRTLGLGQAELKRALDPLRSLCLELEAEIDEYDGLKRGDVDPIESFQHLGRALVGLRIAAGLTQRQLAERLGVHESQVSRDERNEYHGLTVERATRIFNALGVKVTTAFAVPPREDGTSPQPRAGKKPAKAKPSAPARRRRAASS
jgi:transcriptional regulator with XRE-family HTH domain